MQIPAYRDDELGPTLRDLYGKARRTDRLRTVVLWQKDAGEDLPGDVLALPDLTVLACRHEESRGPNWARSILQQEAGDEELTLLLDSHHRFVPGWDELAVGMYRRLRDAGVRKPLLTAYLPSYTPGGGRESRRGDVYKMYPWKREAGMLTRLTSYPVLGWRDMQDPMPAEYLSLHFVLAGREFNDEIFFDPRVYFFGDEVATGLRAYTHGWDLFHPHRIIGWHAYDRSSRRPHWETHPDWYGQHLRSLEQLRSLFTDYAGRSPLLGSARGIEDYEKHIMHRLVDP